MDESRNAEMEMLFAVACAMADEYLNADTEDDKLTDKEYEYIRQQALDRAYYKFGDKSSDTFTIVCTRFAREIADGTFKDFIEEVVSDILEQREIRTYSATFVVESTITVPIRANTDKDVQLYLGDIMQNRDLFESIQSECIVENTEYRFEKWGRDERFDTLADWECLDIRNFVRA